MKKGFLGLPAVKTLHDCKCMKLKTLYQPQYNLFLFLDEFSIFNFILRVCWWMDVNLPAGNIFRAVFKAASPIHRILINKRWNQTNLIAQFHPVLFLNGNEMLTVLKVMNVLMQKHTDEPNSMTNQSKDPITIKS